MNSKAILMIAMLFIPAVVSGKEPAKPISADTFQVLKISVQDERAVIKTPDGKTRIIKPGDFVGISGNVTEIAADRVVIEEKKGNDMEKVIIRLINGKQIVERMKKTREMQSHLFAPVERDWKE
jgi:hypothetical protein